MGFSLRMATRARRRIGAAGWGLELTGGGFEKEEGEGLNSVGGGKYSYLVGNATEVTDTQLPGRSVILVRRMSPAR